MIDILMRECALELQDALLLAKLSVSEAKYHTKCLVNLYNRTKNQDPKCEEDSHESIIHGIELAALMEYIDGSRSECDTVPIFKLIDLAKLYSERLEQLGVFTEDRVNTTHLKNRILTALPV